MKRCKKCRAELKPGKKQQYDLCRPCRGQAKGMIRTLVWGCAG